MTSSEPVRREARLIAAGHLHPGMLFLRLLEGLRGAVLPVILGLATGTLWLVGIAVVWFLIALALALVRYLTFEYRLTDEELITTEGILERQERRIPVNRIQDLSFESSLLRRALGLVVVSVETASAHGAEAKLDSLSRGRAAQLREALYLVRGQLGLTPSGAPALPEGQPLLRTEPGELLLLGLTNNRVGVILAALLGVAELTDELGLAEQIQGMVRGFVRGLTGALALVVAMAALFVALLGGWILSVVASFVMFFGFEVTLRQDVLQRRYGLLTTRAAALPRRRIQRVLLEQTWVRRWLRYAQVRADSAGSGMDPTEQARGGRDVVAPLLPEARAVALVPLLLPGLHIEGLAWQKVSPRVVLRVGAKAMVLALVALGAGLPSIGAWAWLALLLPPLGLGLGALAYRNLGYAEQGEHLGLRSGIVGRYRALLPLRKVQGVVLRADPLDRLLGLAHLTVYVAGGAASAVRHLPRGEAEALQVRWARRAAGARFVW